MFIGGWIGSRHCIFCTGVTDFECLLTFSRLKNQVTCQVRQFRRSLKLVGFKFLGTTIILNNLEVVVYICIYIYIYIHIYTTTSKLFKIIVVPKNLKPTSFKLRLNCLT